MLRVIFYTSADGLTGSELGSQDVEPPRILYRMLRPAPYKMGEPAESVTLRRRAYELRDMTSRGENFREYSYEEVLDE